MLCTYGELKCVSPSFSQSHPCIFHDYDVMMLIFLNKDHLHVLGNRIQDAIVWTIQDRHHHMTIRMHPRTFIGTVQLRGECQNQADTCKQSQCIYAKKLRMHPRTFIDTVQLRGECRNQADTCKQSQCICTKKFKAHDRKSIKQRRRPGIAPQRQQERRVT